MSDQQQVFKYMLIGSNMVGKSAFLARYCENKFIQNYEESKGVDFKSKIFDNGNYKLCLFDTPGSINLRYASYGFYKGAYGFILMFDLTKSQTLKDLRNDLTKISTSTSKFSQLILVGNKSDLEDNPDLRETQIEAQNMANELHIPYFEISCLTGQNVDLVIEDLTKRVQIQIDNGNLGNRADTQQQNHQKDENIKHESGCGCNIF